MEGGNGGWRGCRGGRDDQATAKLRPAVGHQRDKASAGGRWRDGMINGGDQRRRDGFDGREPGLAGALGGADQRGSAPRPAPPGKISAPRAPRP